MLNVDVLFRRLGRWLRNALPGPTMASRLARQVGRWRHLPPHQRASAYAQVQVFWLGFLIDEALSSGKAPLTQVKPAVQEWALYQLWNKPDFSKLRFDQAGRGRKAA